MTDRKALVDPMETPGGRRDSVFVGQLAWGQIPGFLGLPRADAREGAAEGAGSDRNRTAAYARRGRSAEERRGKGQQKPPSLPRPQRKQEEAAKEQALKAEQGAGAKQRAWQARSACPPVPAPAFRRYQQQPEYAQPAAADRATPTAPPPSLSRPFSRLRSAGRAAALCRRKRSTALYARRRVQTAYRRLPSARGIRAGRASRGGAKIIFSRYGKPGLPRRCGKPRRGRHGFSERADAPAQPAVPPAPEDTLQASRDRLTSRWFALNGLFFRGSRSR